MENVSSVSWAFGVAYSAETSAFPQVWERGGPLSRLPPHHPKTWASHFALCFLLLKGPQSKTSRRHFPEEGPSSREAGNSPWGQWDSWHLAASAQRSVFTVVAVRRWNVKTLPWHLVCSMERPLPAVRPPSLQGTQGPLGLPECLTKNKSHASVGLQNRQRVSWVLKQRGIKCYWNLWNVQFTFMCVNNSLLVCNQPAGYHFILALILSWKRVDWSMTITTERNWHPLSNCSRGLPPIWKYLSKPRRGKKREEKTF